MHNHSSCEHQLKYCSHCDLVYCEKCGKEWKLITTGSTTITVPYIPGTGTYPNFPNVTYCSSNPINHNHL